MLAKNIVAICISSFTVLLCQGQIYSLQGFPPLLSEFIVQTHSKVCPKVTKTFMAMDAAAHSAALQEHLLRDLNIPLVVVYDKMLLRRMLLSLNCVIFFTFELFLTIHYLVADAKFIVVMEEKEFDQKYSNSPVSYSTVFITYDDNAYRSLHVSFPTGELIFNATSFTTQINLNDLHSCNLRIAFTPGFESKAVEEFWRTISTRHNITYTQPLEVHSSLSGLIQAMQKLSVSLHRLTPRYGILVPVYRQRPLGYLLVDPFDLPIWICVLFSMAVVLLVLRTADQSRFNFSRTTLVLVQILINNPHETSRPAVHRFIITVFITGSFILTSSYESLLTATISQPSYYPPLDNYDIVNRSCNPMYKIEPQESTFNFMYEADGLFREYRSGCFVGSTLLLEAVSKMIRNDPNYQEYTYGRSRVEMVPFPAFVYLVTSPHQSILVLLRHYAVAFAQTGLPHLVYGGNSVAKRKPDTTQRRALSFGELVLVWKLVAYGWGISCVIFCTELMRFHGKSCRTCLKKCYSRVLKLKNREIPQ